MSAPARLRFSRTEEIAGPSRQIYFHPPLQISSPKGGEDGDKAGNNKPTQSDQNELPDSPTQGPDTYYHSGLDMYLTFPSEAIEHAWTVELPLFSSQLSSYNFGNGDGHHSTCFVSMHATDIARLGKILKKKIYRRAKGPATGKAEDKSTSIKVSISEPVKGSMRKVRYYGTWNF